MDAKGWTIRELSEELGIKENAVKQRIFKAHIKPIVREAIYPPDTIDKIREAPMGRPKKTEDAAYSIQPAKVFETHEPEPPYVTVDPDAEPISNVVSIDYDMAAIPYLGEDIATAAGELREMLEDPGAYRPLYVPRNLFKTDPKNCFGLKIRGISMTGAGISDGDVGVFKIAGEPENHEIMLCMYEGESTMKRTVKKNKVWHLCWEDGSGKEIAVKKEGFQTLGKLLFFLKP
jgi:SOS-response transcriptional repressor LexA